MAFVRKKKIKGNTYYYLVEGFTENGRIKQRVIRYLGTPDTILERYTFWDEKH